MTVSAKCLIDARYAQSSAAIEYVAFSAKAIIDKFTATNTDSSARTISIYIVPSSGSYGPENQIVKDKSIDVGATYGFDSEMQNQILNSGDSIVVVASVASKVVIRTSGREIT